MREPLKITRETLMYIEELWENNTDPIYSIIESFKDGDGELPEEIHYMINHDNLDLYRVILKDLTFEVVEEYVKEPKVGVVYLDTTTIPDDVLVSLNPFTKVLERFYISSSNFYSKHSTSYDFVEKLKLKEASPEQKELFEIAKSYHGKVREFGELKEMDIIEVMDNFEYPHSVYKHTILLLNSLEMISWAHERSSKIKLLASQGEIQKLIAKPVFLHSVDQPK